MEWYYRTVTITHIHWLAYIERDRDLWKTFPFHLEQLQNEVLDKYLTCTEYDYIPQGVSLGDLHNRAKSTHWEMRRKYEWQHWSCMKLFETTRNLFFKHKHLSVHLSVPTNTYQCLWALDKILVTLIFLVSVSSSCTFEQTLVACC